MRKLDEDNKYFHFVNVNPKGKMTGDCAYRALATFLNISWEDACRMDMDYYLQTGNSFECHGISQLLHEKFELTPKAINAHPSKGRFYGVEYGMDSEKVPFIGGGRCYTIRQFVDCFATPDKIYLFVLQNHYTVVKSMKVWDTWDCSNAHPLVVFEAPDPYKA